MTDEVERLRELCACAYQLAGAHDAPVDLSVTDEAVKALRHRSLWERVILALKATERLWKPLSPHLTRRVTK